MKRQVFLLPAVLIVVCFSFLHANTIHVPADSATIQAGINGAMDGDTVLVADGTYTGDGNRDIDFLGKAIVVMSENGAESCVIDCEGSALNPHRGFYFHNGEGSSSVVQGFTIQNGYAYGDLPQNSGGGMLIEDSSPTVTNCTFSGNTSYHAGGGMYNSYSSATVTNCTFSGNSAANYGGGGMWSEDSSPTVTNCTFTDNTATGGGGMANSSSDATTVTNCTFSGNSVGGVGGGMYNRYSNTTVTNCTFSGNLAAAAGGGMRNTSSSPTVTNCTFSGNIGSYSGGGGMYNVDSSRPIVTNCILWGDSPDEISGGDPTVTYSNIQGGWPGEGNIDADPLFVLPDKDEYRLLWPSPCIDTGDPNLFDPDGTRSDMGAHFFNQDDYLTLYLTPDATEVSPGNQLGVTYTAINRWGSPESFWLLSQVLLSGGSWFNVLGPDSYTLPANYTAQVHITHPVPNITPLGMYEYRSLIGLPPGTLYDEDSFKLTVIE